MTKKLSVTTVLCLLAFPALAIAQEQPGAWLPRTVLFVGLGGSFNSAEVDQDLSGTAISNVFSASTLVAFGNAGGPAEPFQSTESALAPQAQVGYFSHFSDSSWLWGFKFLYQYAAVTTANRDILPQAGEFTTTGAAPPGTTFTGNVVIGSSQTRLNHQIAFMPFIGQAFGNGYVYGGGGPVLFGIQSNIYNAIGFADVNCVHMDVTGTPANFASSNWVWGGAAQVGVTYFLGESWFLDANYTYMRTGQFTNDYVAPFVSSSSGYTTMGTANLSVPIA
jgi:hypothetical protein